MTSPRARGGRISLSLIPTLTLTLALTLALTLTLPLPRWADKPLAELPVLLATMTLVPFLFLLGLGLGLAPTLTLTQPGAARYHDFRQLHLPLDRRHRRAGLSPCISLYLPTHLPISPYISLYISLQIEEPFAILPLEVQHNP